MAKMRTDDSIWRAKLVYLGWGRTALPVQWPYVKWVLFLAIFTGTTMLLGLILQTFYVVFMTPGVSLIATSFIYDRVDADRRVRDVVRTAATDWHRDQPAELTGPETLATSHITIGGRR